MMKININSLKQVFSQFPDIQAVYLFGSQVTGKTHAESDLDLAVYPGTKALKKQKLDILTELVKAGYENADLSFIDEDSDLVLAYEAVHQNCLVYHTKLFQRGTVYSKIVRMYLDFLPYLNVQRQAYKERILRG